MSQLRKNTEKWECEKIKSGLISEKLVIFVEEKIACFWKCSHKNLNSPESGIEKTKIWHKKCHKIDAKYVIKEGCKMDTKM